MLRRLIALPYLLVPTVLATSLYAPALFYGKTQIHGDSILHSLVALDFNRKWLHEGVSPLWSNLVYGGHPYFAEGQGGFLNPLNIIVAFVFDPIAGLNVYHWLAIILGAAGMFFLCRHFRCTPEASTFGALAAAFSAYWLKYHDNVTVSGALCILPWVILCFECWVERPGFKTAVWLAVAVALLIFAGYPQAFHGAVLYMAVSLIPTLCLGHIGHRSDQSVKQYVWTGLAAVAICIGLSAVQWLPLLELSTWSHRSGGVDILYPAPLSMYLRGFLFTISGPDVKTAYFGLAGSAMVCFIASLSAVMKPNHRIIGHILAVIVLTVLGLEYATPVFKYLLTYSLVPGLKYFRIAHPYIGVAIAGLGLLCGFAIDRIQQQKCGPTHQKKNRLVVGAFASVLFLAWLALVLWLKTNEVSAMTYGSFFGLYIAFLLVMLINKPSWFGHVALFFLVLEVVFLRLSPAPFVHPGILDKPRYVHHIRSDVNNRDYRIMDLSAAGGVGFVNPWSSNLVSAIQNAVHRAFPSTNVLWNIPSMDANLALPQARRRLIQPKMEAEIKGTDATQPGLRLIDYLGVRYISADSIFPSPGLVPLMSDGILIMENKNALPRIQSFTRHEIVKSGEEALDRLTRIKEPALILEPPFSITDRRKDLPSSARANDSTALDISPVKMTNVEYHFDVNARQPAWLFIADANYPGWRASIDDHPVPVYSAQVLGKAVPVPAGQHRVKVAYEPLSFTIGLSLTVLTVVVILGAGIGSVYLKRSRFLGRQQAAG